LFGRPAPFHHRDDAPLRLVAETINPMPATTARRRPSTYLVPLALYLREIDATPLLTAVEESELARRISEGDPYARDQMVRANLRLVVSVARGYLNRGLPIEDLIAEGNLGLVRAVEGFNPAWQTRFGNYASYWIKQSMRQAVIKTGRSFRLPAYMVTLLAKWRRATAVLADRLGRDPTNREVGELLKLSGKTLRMVIQAVWVEALKPHPDEDGFGMGEFLADKRHRDVHDELCDSDELKRVFVGIEQLDEREAMVIRLRFGLESRPPMTLQEIGEGLGLNREGVRRVEARALTKLAHGLSRN
jgi:RNA polymerase primary sigma factor